MELNIKSILEQMTLEEKASMCSGEDIWQLKVIERLNIPRIRLCDGPSGLRLQNDADNHLGVNASEEMVCYPAGSAAASSFDRELMKEQGSALGEECQASNIAVVLGPAFNIKRSPLCGRNFEYLSEDPFLAGEMAAAQIKGIQSQNVGACVKHFACNNQEDWRMWTNSQVDTRTLREIYLAAFERAIKEAKPWAVMCSYNRLNGVYTSEHPWLLTEVLRSEWGFEGLVMSDWGAVSDRTAALKAGLDLEMPGGNKDTDAQIAAAVRSNELKEQVLDQAVERILTMIYRYAKGRNGIDTYDREAHHDLAVKMAQESAVLLKNDNHILPLSRESKTAFIGEFAKKPRFLGGGSACVKPFKISNALDEAAEFAQITYAPGFYAESDEKNPEWFKEAVHAAREAETVVIFAGLPDSYESECWDRHHMRLPDCQNELIMAVCEVQKNVVVVLHNGSPVEMPWINSVSAVLEMHTAGQGVGAAAVNLLYGKGNPCGKLAETMPMKLEDNPSYLNFPGDGNTVEYREGIYVGYRYYDKKKMEVLYPFGHGLSYTTFAYSSLHLDKSVVKDSETVTVSVNITNTGIRQGKEIVQLYVSDATGTFGRPKRELKGFEKIDLSPGETKTVCFVLDKRSFAWYCTDIQDWYCSSGIYKIQIGASSRDMRLETEIELVSSVKLPQKITMNTLMSTVFQYPQLAEETKRSLRASSPKVEQFMSGEDETSVYLREELMELPFHAIRGLYETPQRDLDKLIDRLNQMLNSPNQIPAGAQDAKATKA